ncbi:MAG: tRNA 2-thiouridine(34) synthase MnmA [Gammaproteobacteria bacterium]|nr:tRNA 2-thiouridine(34) synthase MnmA [Gammaproteobacteria bacterium]
MRSPDTIYENVKCDIVNILQKNEKMSASSPIVVGVSGGVDSSVAAYLLKEQGCSVHGLFMKNWEEDDKDGHCSAAEDLADARAVCNRLDIPLHTVNFSGEYWEQVFTHFLAEYKAGRTPNPDVLCNREIKFKAFLEYALQLGGTGIATGHYARIHREDGKFQLLKGCDPAKDQSYFLYTLNQTQLAQSRFPLGELHKSEVRKLAEQASLATHAKKDSTGICFIGERRFKTFLARFLPPRPGPVETPEGHCIGRHDGLMYYTLGQRQGLGIGGQKGGSGQPWYVAGKDLPNNRLIAVQGHNHPLLFTNHLNAADVHWITAPPPSLPYACRAKTRYRQPDQDCRITRLADNCCKVHFDRPQRAVTPGQSVVFYQGEQCLGGGIII